MSKLTEKKPLVSLGKPKANAATIAAQNDRTKVSKSEDQKRLNVNINNDLHGRFKSAVARKNLDMSKVTTELLENWLSVNE